MAKRKVKPSDKDWSLAVFEALRELRKALGRKPPLFDDTVCALRRIAKR
jgi:hypothetical protein